jgi:three-Cys-motif partner protein
MDERYEGREQSATKHLILSRYLEKLAYKIGHYRPHLTLNYIDGFAGPWESKSDDLSDTSPSLALRSLTKVRDDLNTQGRLIKVRAFFVSLTEDGVTQLRSLEQQFPDVEIMIANGRFEDMIEEARRFSKGGLNPFTFIFIDHTGWTGFGLHEITPLLRDGNNEVLINFMTGHITRFIDSGDNRYEGSFVALFGDASYRQQWLGLEGLDREDAIVEAYCRRVADAGGYSAGVASVILNPRSDRTHFHLVYGTRSDEGLVVFRDVEKDAIEFQRAERAAVQQRERVKRTGQGELFGAAPIHRYEDELLERAWARMDRELGALLRARRVVGWDEVVRHALHIPLICEKSVKNWVRSRIDTGQVRLLGLRKRERVPKRRENHRVELVVPRT